MVIENLYFLFFLRFFISIIFRFGLVGMEDGMLDLKWGIWVGVFILLLFDF